MDSVQQQQLNAQIADSLKNANDELKIAISNVKWPGAVPGSDYGSFNLVVSGTNTSDKLVSVANGRVAT